MAIKVSKYKLNLFFILAVSLFVSLMAFNNSYALEVGGVEIPSDAVVSQSGSIYYDCVSGYMTSNFQRYGYVRSSSLSGSIDCSSYPNATQALVESIDLSQGIADFSNSYMHLVLKAPQNFVDYCGPSGTGPCSLYINTSFVYKWNNNSSSNVMKIYDGLTCEVESCSVTSTPYFSIPIYSNNSFYTFTEFAGIKNFSGFQFYNSVSSRPIFAFSDGDSFDFTYYLWGSSTSLKPEIVNDLPDSPIWSDPDFTDGGSVASELQFSFNITNPFSTLIPYFSDNASFCPQVLHTWLHLSNSCIQSPWSSTIRTPITITANILLAVFLFGFVISWLKYGEVPIRPIPAVGSSDSPASHGIHGNKGGFSRL